MYAELRQEEASSKMPHSYTTARTLMSILRLSQALARLRFSQAVLQVGLPSLAHSALFTAQSCKLTMQNASLATSLGQSSCGSNAPKSYSPLISFEGTALRVSHSVITARWVRLV